MSDTEDTDLEQLRLAVFASLKSRTKEKEKNPIDEKEALQSKSANDKNYSMKRHKPMNYWPKVPGPNAFNSRPTFRSNLIVINTGAEEDSNSQSKTSKKAAHLQLPQDKWSGVESAKQSIQKPKGLGKFSRCEDSSGESSEEDFDAPSPVASLIADSEEDDIKDKNDNENLVEDILETDILENESLVSSSESCPDNDTSEECRQSQRPKSSSSVVIASQNNNTSHLPRSVVSVVKPVKLAFSHANDNSDSEDVEDEQISTMPASKRRKSHILANYSQENISADASFGANEVKKLPVHMRLGYHASSDTDEPSKNFVNSKVQEKPKPKSSDTDGVLSKRKRRFNCSATVPQKKMISLVTKNS